MILQAGVRLGPYQVVSLLREGGTGEVYRAQDLRLHRAVAIQVLGRELARDASRLLRLEREVLAVSALAHPNIPIAYEFGSYNGLQYLVAELVEGTTLRERLGEGMVPLRKAVDCALQVAAGLAAAHDQGVIHRDLKPESLLLTAEGRVQILDFGLAKGSPSAAAATGAETARTAPGDLPSEPALPVLVGTPGYRSPEQILGLPLDARSDIFALGLVLYELLYGRRAFARPSALETSMAILKEDPQMDPGSNRLVPTALQRVVQRCLEKNPQERFQSARDIAYALEALSALSEERSLLGPLLGEAKPVPAPISRRTSLALGGAGLLLSYAGAFVLGQRLQRPRASGAPRFRQLTYRRGVVDSARFAPDGNTVVYGAAWEQSDSSVYAVRIDQPQSRLLYADARRCAVSSLGELALFQTGGDALAASTLSRVPLSGGAPRELLTGVHAADWSADGTQLAVICSADNLFRLEYPIGRVLYQTPCRMSGLRVSPCGQRVAFLEHPIVGDTCGTVSMVEVNGRHTVLTRRFSHVGSLVFSPDGAEIWFSAAETGLLTALWGVRLSGEERLLMRMAGALRIHDVGRDGRALVSQDKFQADLLARPLGSAEERDLSWFDFSRAVALSADGQTLLFDESGEGGGLHYSTFLRKLDGSPALRLGEGTALALSPDGRWALAMVTDHTPQLVLWRTGPGQPVVLPSHGLSSRGMGCFTPDSLHVLWSASAPGHAARWYRQAIAGGSPEPLLAEGVEVCDISPDGQWLLASRPGPAPGTQQLALYPTGGGPPRAIPYGEDGTLDPLSRPLRFGVGGASILVCHNARDPRRHPARIEQIDLATGNRRTVLELRPADLAGFTKIMMMTLTADAQVYAYSCFRSSAALYLVDGLT